MLVRHPVSRLLSAYLGKVDTDRGYAQVHFPGWNRSTGFAGFVRLVTAAGAEKPGDSHFSLQSQQCGLSSGAAEAIGGYRYLRVEEMGRWYRDVVCTLGMSAVVSAENIYWRNHYNASNVSSSEYKTSVQCFVKTQDCGCELHCHGSHRCNSKLAKTPRAEFGTFIQASDVLEHYYTEDLAQRVNMWARADLDEFGYVPWRRGMEMSTLLAPLPTRTRNGGTGSQGHRHPKRGVHAS